MKANKEFLPAESIRDNALLLARRMHEDGFIPDVIYVGLRGGTTFGNAISEYFKLVAHNDTPPLYAAVVAHSYEGLSSTQQVYIDGWTYEPKFLRRYDRVLLVDDIFDLGLTINVITEKLIEKGVSRDRLMIAVHDYKIREFVDYKRNYIPDYYSRKHIIKTPEEDNWIHYLSHELAGLTEEEITEYYPSHVQEIIKDLIRKHN